MRMQWLLFPKPVLLGLEGSNDQRECVILSLLLEDAVFMGVFLIPPDHFPRFFYLLALPFLVRKGLPPEGVDARLAW